MHALNQLIEEACQLTSYAPFSTAETEPVLRLFHHNIYMYTRGVRPLFLMTVTSRELDVITTKLDGRGIDYFIQGVNSSKANLFFGRPAFVAVARAFITRPLNQLTPKEDFMLGTLLGYDSEQQCHRFLNRNRDDLAD